MIDELLKKYEEEYGPLPLWLLQGADDEYTAGLITRAFNEKKPIDELDMGDVIF